jgi:hypothetical protein
MMYLPNSPRFVAESAIISSFPYVPYSGENDYDLSFKGLLVDKMGKRFLYTVLLSGQK